MNDFQNQQSGAPAPKDSREKAVPYFIGIIIVAVIVVGYILFKAIGLL